ncbi:MAG: hypothetical protein LBI15_00105 [Dysgonamonadaceae bacterium]|jgi:hypothetical protein|nr:hypothetical protein [Dysgonamonadaceae bacterium]
MYYIKGVISMFFYLLIFCACVHTNRENTRQNVNQIQSELVRGNETINAGWDFIKNRMLSPSTAKLVSYKHGNEAKRILLQYSPNSNAQLINCITVGYFEYDAQNAFGAMIRDKVFVFYKNGNPCWIETASDLDETFSILTRSGISQNFIPTINAALEFNGCGCE